jgi:cell division septation protein DedD
MTKHTMVKFTLHRKGVILIAILGIVLAVLLVVVGYIAGSLHARTTSAAAAAPVPKPATATTASAAASPPESFALRVGIAASEEEANEAVKHFKAKKVAAIVVPAELHDGTVVYEIHAGPYAGREQALAAAEALKNDGISSDLVPAP